MDVIRKVYGLLILAAGLVALTMNLTIDVAMILVIGLAFG